MSSSRRLWLMQRAPVGEYRDEVLGMVIAASDERMARSYARDNARAEGADAWNAVPCRRLGNGAPGVEKGVVLMHVREP